jgi:hypothetical protein
MPVYHIRIHLLHHLAQLDQRGQIPRTRPVSHAEIQRAATGRGHIGHQFPETIRAAHIGVREVHLVVPGQKKVRQRLHMPEDAVHPRLRDQKNAHQ